VDRGQRNRDVRRMAGGVIRQVAGGDDACVVGVDFGTLSGRALVVRVWDGAELSTAGLPEGIAVAVGNVDAHVTPPAADAIALGQMVAIMGTSTCHVMNGAALAEVPGMCGAVDGGIVAGQWGYEAGQSGVGDIFAWLAKHATPPFYIQESERRGLSVPDLLAAEAAAQPVGAHGLIALDWLSGNRSVLVDHARSGTIVGLTLGTRAPDIYRALVESTAFGTRVIIEGGPRLRRAARTDPAAADRRAAPSLPGGVRAGPIIGQAGQSGPARLPPLGRMVLNLMSDCAMPAISGLGRCRFSPPGCPRG
jgi:FGGY family of carbohydrate kinases, C-terminal domain